MSWPKLNDFDRTERFLRSGDRQDPGSGAGERERFGSGGLETLLETGQPAPTHTVAAHCTWNRRRLPEIELYIFCSFFNYFHILLEEKKKARDGGEDGDKMFSFKIPTSLEYRAGNEDCVTRRDVQFLDIVVL